MTDVIAKGVYAEARSKSGAFIEDNPICYGYTVDDLADAMDLSQAEVSRGRRRDHLRGRPPRVYTCGSGSFVRLGPLSWSRFWASFAPQEL